MRLQNKVTIITGGGSGMGLESSILFAKEGAKVVVVDYQGANKEAPGKKAAEYITNNFGEAIYIDTDVSDDKQVQTMVESVLSTYGKIDVLFNNASISLRKNADVKNDILGTSESDWDFVLRTNLKSVYLCCKYSLPYMVKNGGGSVINNASINGLVALTGADAYTASKGGVIALTRVLAVDYGDKNVRVNCICPGPIETPMLAGHLANPKVRSAYESNIPLGRVGKPEEVANLALFLASDESSFITGTIIPIDGGHTAK